MLHANLYLHSECFCYPKWYDENNLHFIKLNNNIESKSPWIRERIMVWYFFVDCICLTIWINEYKPNDAEGIFAFFSASDLRRSTVLSRLKFSSLWRSMGPGLTLMPKNTQIGPSMFLKFSWSRSKISRSFDNNLFSKTRNQNDCVTVVDRWMKMTFVCLTDCQSVLFCLYLLKCGNTEFLYYKVCDLAVALLGQWM